MNRIIITIADKNGKVRAKLEAEGNPSDRAWELAL